MTPAKARRIERRRIEKRHGHSVRAYRSLVRRGYNPAAHPPKGSA